jgi:very-short-patch-repair endonuclease
MESRLRMIIVGAAGHTTPVEVLRDAGRYTRLVDRGWRIYRYTKYDVYGDPGRIVAELARALQCS